MPTKLNQFSVDALRDVFGPLYPFVVELIGPRVGEDGHFELIAQSPANHGRLLVSTLLGDVTFAFRSWHAHCEKEIAIPDKDGGPSLPMSLNAFLCAMLNDDVVIVEWFEGGRLRCSGPVLANQIPGRILGSEYEVISWTGKRDTKRRSIGQT